MRSRIAMWYGIAVAALAACGQEDAPPGTKEVVSAPECELEEYACTWSEVAPETVEHTEALGEIAGLYGQTGAPLDSLAAFLARQPDVAAVEVIGTGVRYRLEGGRPAWVYPEDELAHHRDTGDARLSTLPAHGAKAASTVHLGPLVRWVTPDPLMAAGVQTSSGQGVAAEEPGSGKKALILSPFEWEFPGTGSGFARRVRLIRDYMDRHEGGVVLHADLDEFGANLADVGDGLRTVDGALLLSGEVQFEDFLHWDRHNLVILASHGTEHRCGARAPVGGERMPIEDSGGARRPSPGLGRMCPLIWAGRAKQENYGDYLGVELISFVGNLYEPHPGLTSTEAQTCAQLLREREEALSGGATSRPEPETPGGKPCRIKAGDREKKLVALWTPFFRAQYPEGLENVILFLGACRSGINDVLLDHFVRPGNEHVAVFGFDDTVAGADAFDVASEMLKLIDAGYHSEEMIRRLKAMDRTNHLVGRSLAPGDETLPARPAQIAEAATAPTHGRDVALLVVPGTGAELEDGGAVQVVGTAGDGETDSLLVFPQVIGVAPSDDRSEMRLQVFEAGRTPGPERYEPDLEVGGGAWRHDGPVSLGRDHASGEVVDLEVRVTLPGGDFSRWVYEDVRITSGSMWSVNIDGGPAGGSHSGSDGSVTIASRSGQEGDRQIVAGQIMRIGLKTEPGDGRVPVPGSCPLVLLLPSEDGTLARVGSFLFQGSVTFGDCEGDFGNLMEGTGYELGNGDERPGAPGPVTVTIEAVTEERISGTFTGRFFQARDQAGNNFIEYERQFAVSGSFSLPRRDWP